MILPRRLMTFTDKAGEVHFCEEDDERQDMNFRPKGFVIPDVEAERIGLKAYLDETGWGETAREKGERKVTQEAFEKAVAQQETENKAVDAPTDDTTGVGLHINKEPPPGPAEPPKPEEKDDTDPAQRRSRRGG